jgi:hypothetical protein
VERSPQLVDPEPINLESLTAVIAAFMLLIQDIDAVVKAKTGDYLPTLDKDTKDEIWSEVEKAIRAHFKNHSNMFMKYLHWSHAAQPPEINIEIGSRPPVGRFAPGFRGQSGGRKGGGGDRNRGPRNDQRRNQKNDNRGEGRGSRQQNSRNSKPDTKKNHQLERETLKAVLIAVQKLNEDKSLTEYSLPPANSFYRRLQHKQIKEEGLFSKSDGTGNDRRVVILRSKPSGHENHE